MFNTFVTFRCRKSLLMPTSSKQISRSCRQIAVKFVYFLRADVLLVSPLIWLAWARKSWFVE